jgi:asparagine synthase (glutamine-hydrolysing)
MCGVVGAFGAALPALGQRAAALETLRLRGPDARGEHLGPGAWLGHTRLAIVAPADGAQPLTSEDGAVVAVVNGEIYDDARLRRELEARGHRFRTASDSELVVHLYEEHGDAFIDHLRGELACLLWDARRQRLVAARDRFGVKPLVWATLPGGALALASEAKALFALGLPRAWDEQAFLHAVRHQYLPPERSLFAGVRTVPPAHVLIAEASAPPRLRCYWDLDAAPDVPAGLEDPRAAAEAVRDALDEAVRLRLRADVPVAFALSGGLDSSLVLALAARHLPGSPEAFGVCFEHPPYDERRAAQAVAAHVGARFNPVVVTQDALLDALPEAVRCAEGLAINGQLPAKHLLAAAIRGAGYPVVLTGEGADELLLGYPFLIADLAAAAPPAQARAALQALLRDNPASRGVMLPDGALEAADDPGLAALRRRLGFVPTFLRAKAAFGARLLGLLDDRARARVAADDPMTALLDSPALNLPELPDLATRGAHPVAVSASLWARLALAGYILRTLGDGTEMAHSVEGRPPFLDHRVAELATALPVALRLRDGRPKAVLRDAAAGLLPADTVARPKHPFLAPPVTRFASPRGRALLEDVLRSAAVEGVPFVDRGRVGALLDALPVLAPEAQAAAEPVLFTLLTATLLSERLLRSTP